MSKNTLLLMMTWLLALHVAAAPVDVATARCRATACLATRSSVALSLHHAEPSAVDGHAAAYYVFNATDGSAFVIVAGDDRAQSILAYGEGTLDMERLPCNVRCWLDQYREQMDSLMLSNPRPARHEAVVCPVVQPLLTCRWDQTSPYNRMCPVVNGSHCVTGCVATAMAQVMYYWRFPDEVPGLPAYTTSHKRIDMPALPATVIRWEDMLDAYISSNYSDTQAEAVATLMLYCGQAVHMDYGPGSSSAYVGHVEEAMRLFGYNDGLTMIARYNYGDSLWTEMINEDLTAGRPILYCAENASGSMSHAFVIDGCDGAKYHINWGWGGLANGYFSLDAFTSGLNYRHGMVFQTFPEGKEGVRQAYDLEVDGIFYKLTGTTARVTFGPGKYSGNIVIPDAVTHEGRTYPVTTIGTGAFAGCTALTSVVIGEQVTSVGDKAFSSCTALKRVALPASAVIYHHQAFIDCTALDTVDVNDLNTWFTATFLDAEASPMYYAHHLRVQGEEITHVEIPGNMTAVGDYCFRNCQSLVSVDIPNSVTAIGRYAFYHCTSLTHVTMGEAVASIGYAAFSGCKRLIEIDLPESLRDMERYAFQGCERLERVTIPNSLTMVSGYTFNRCMRLKKVTLGAAVDTVGYYAFMGCTALDSVVCRTQRPPHMNSKSCFNSATYPNAVLLVPRAAFGAYQGDSYWGLFNSIGFIDTGAGPFDLNADGELNVADVNILIDILIAGRSGPYDTNGDAELSIADVNTLIDAILSQQHQ